MISVLLLLALGAAAKRYAFHRISTFPVCKHEDPACNTDAEHVAEIIATANGGNTVISTNSARETLDFVDITDPRKPYPIGTVNVGGEPTSVAVKGNYALVAVSTSETFTNPSGFLRVYTIDDRSFVAELDLGGQPDSIAVSPDGNYAAVAIENERDEDLGDGGLPQLPAGTLVVIDISNADPTSWSTSTVALTGLAGVTAPEDPEPEFVDINEDNVLVVTLQENNALALVDLETSTVIKSFSAGTVSLDGIDVLEEDMITLDGSLTDVPREPDGVAWIDNRYFATADEGDWNGGSRGFTIFDSENGEVVYTSGADLDQMAVRFGHYPDSRSENKGNEPENITVGTFGGKKMLFVNSERSSIVFVYDVTNPEEPKYLQALPSGKAPEGGKTIESRGLLIVASEKDSREDKLRSVLTIYEYRPGRPQYPTLVSRKDKSGMYISWGALSGLSGGPEGRLYTVEDSYYKSSRFFEIDTTRPIPTIIKATRIVDTNDVFAQFPLSGDFDEFELAAMINDDKTVNIDPEGIAAMDDGTFWIASEGKGTFNDATMLNFLFHVDRKGVIQDVVTLPEELNMKQIKYGFEGVAATKITGAQKLVVVVQRAWDTDKNPMIAMYDVDARSWDGWAYYPLDDPESQNGGWTGLSAITSLGDRKFLVLERDNQFGSDASVKRVYEIHLNMHPIENHKTIEKTYAGDLMSAFGLTGSLIPEKMEGLAVDFNGDVWVINDNDGVDDNSGETQLINLGSKESCVGRKRRTCAGLCIWWPVKKCTAIAGLTCSDAKHSKFCVQLRGCDWNMRTLKCESGPYEWNTHFMETYYKGRGSSHLDISVLG